MSKMLSTAMKLSKYLWFIPGESITTQDNIFHDIYFPPDIASLIFHEVIGHAFEGDTYFSMESPLCKFHFGERICISGIDIINISNGMWLGAEGFDDEGTVGKYQYLVHNGIFVDLMVDNYLAKKYHLSPCGNCRSAYPFHTTNIRMTNFVVQRCNDSHLILNDQIIQWVAYEPKLLYAMNNGKFSILIGKLVNVKSNIVLSNLIYTDEVSHFLHEITSYSDDFSAFTGICEKNGEKINVTNGSIGVLMGTLFISHS